MARIGPLAIAESAFCCVGLPTGSGFAADRRPLDVQVRGYLLPSERLPEGRIATVGPHRFLQAGQNLPVTGVLPIEMAAFRALTPLLTIPSAPRMSADPWPRLNPVLEAKGITLNGAQRLAIDAYVALLTHWNRRINLVRAHGREELFVRHILDCLMLEAVPRHAHALRWLDIGAGAGLPSVLIALLHPDYTITAVDTVAKKVTFLREVARRLELPNLTPLREDVRRLASSQAGAPRFDIVVSRAFAELSALLALGTRLLGPAGELWAMKGKRLTDERTRVPAATLAYYAPEPHFHPYTLPDGGSGEIVVYRRVAS